MKKKTLVFSLVLTVWLTACAGVGIINNGNNLKKAQPVYSDTSCSFEERAADIISRLTIEEKQSLLGNTMAAVPRLGINEYQVWGEALHGVVGVFNRKITSSTSFPNSVALGSAWDPGLIEREATVISEEARAGNSPVPYNLTYWSPVVEPARDPRWGRTGESYGEDPFLISRIAGGFIRGMMGYDPTYLKAVPTAKHYIANNSEFNRHVGSANMDARDMREYYLAPYKHLIEKDRLTGIMTAYSAVNGVPVTASKSLVDGIARKTYGLNGYVTSDCSGVEDIYAGHGYAANGAEAAADGLIAGVDTNCGRVYQISTISALEEGLITEAEIDRALLHIFTIRMRTGEFDPKPLVPYSNITPETLNSSANTELAEKVAEKTPVLLKNFIVSGTTKKALPLDVSQLSKIAVIGPQADRVELGPYSGRPMPSNMITPLDGIKTLLKEKGSTAEVVHNAGAITASLSNMYSVLSFEIYKTDGSSQTYDATVYNSITEGIEVAGGSGMGKALKQISDGAWSSYKNIDCSNIESIGIRVTVPGLGGRVEVRTGSDTGDLLSEIKIKGSGPMSAFNPATLTAKVNNMGLTGDKTLYFVYRGPELPPVDQEAIDMASSSDVAIVFVGTNDETTGEENDRVILTLPGNQVELIKAVAEVNPNTIVVMQTMGMVEVEEFKDLPNIPGIIWTGFNGQAQGTAMAHILFGDANPGGKLNATWFKTLNDLPAITDYTLRGGQDKNGRTYWYFDGDVSYEFGYGLSYTAFDYSNFKISQAKITPNDKITISVDVENSGPVDGDEVVQVYMKTPDSPSSFERPIKRLKGFKRVTIPAGETIIVTVPIDCADLWFWDGDQDKITFDQGRYIFEIGSSSKDIRGQVEADMGGSYQSVLETVVAETRKVVLDLGETVQTVVTASMSDDSFYDIDSAEVVYKSNNPDVAAVNEDGQVTAKGAGTATITAYVTVDKKTVSGSYPVKVMPNLNLSNLTINGERIQGFDPTVHGYCYLFDMTGSKVPQVEAIPVDVDKSVKIFQAPRIPGTAIITVSDPNTGEKEKYSVSFGIKSASDEFDSVTIGKQWEWARESRGNWSLSNGMLTITAQNGDLRDDSNNAQNILLQNANTDWTIESKITYSTRPGKIDQEGGLIAYQDDDNYVKLVYGYAGKGFMGNNEFIELIYEADGAQYSAANVKTADLLSDSNLELLLKLKKNGTIYTAYYSTDRGESFKVLGSTEVILSDLKAGLITCGGNVGNAAGGSFFPGMMGQPSENESKFEVSYDYFRIANTGL